MGIEIIGKLTQKNNGDFKLVDLADVDYDGTGKSAKQELEKKIEEAKNSSTPYDDSAIKADINTIKTDLGTETLNTTAKDVKGAVNEVNAQYKDIANIKADKNSIDNIRQQVNNLVLGAVGDGNNAEVIQARGHFSTLNDRYEHFESQLQQTEKDVNLKSAARTNILSSSLPYIHKEDTVNGLINVKHALLNDKINVKTSNLLSVNDETLTSGNCDYSIENEDLLITVSKAYSGWYNCYVEIAMDNLDISKDYYLTGLVKQLEFYDQMVFRNCYIYSSDMTLIKDNTDPEAYNGHITINFKPTTTSIKIRIYPDYSGSNDENSVKKYRVSELMLYEGTNKLAYAPKFNKIYTLDGGATIIPVKLYNGITISSESTSLSLDILKIINPLYRDQVKKSKIEGKTVVCFGDSITGNYSYPTDYPTIISDITGATVYNVGFGGCRMGKHVFGDIPNDYDWFCMYKLVDAIISGDFSKQEEARNNLNNDVYTPKLNTLKNIDFNKVDYITIAYGTNDLMGNMAGENITDPNNFYYFKNAARYVLKKIYATYPHIKVLLITPLFRADDVVNGDSDTYVNPNTNSKLPDFCNDLVDLGKEFKIPVCDNYYSSGINKYNYTYYLEDKLHPKEDVGIKRIGEHIASSLINY